MAALDHPNVVHAYDVNNSGDIHYLVMEYVDGESLEQLVRRGGPLPTKDAADYIAQAARGLQHAFERGLVHRDIKPANLVLDKSGVIKVLDLGLARFFEESSSLTSEMGAGAVIGTADYMAPEQAVNSHDVDVRADIYSLGITLYALLTGQPPFARSNVAQKLLAHQMRQPDPIQDSRPDVPDELAEIMMKMMAKNPDERQQTPGEVAAALADWIKSSDLASALTAKIDNTIVQRHPNPTPTNVKKRRKALAIAGGIGIVAITGAIIGFASSGDKKPEVAAAKNNEQPAPGRISWPTLPKTAATAPVNTPTTTPKEIKIGELRHYDTRNHQMQRVALSPNEHWLAGGGDDGWLKVWDLDSGAMRADVQAHTGAIRFVRFAPSGKLMLTAGQDGWIKIWNTQTWKEERKFGKPEKGLVKCAVFSPDENEIFAGGEDGVGRFWNVRTGELVRSCNKQHDAPKQKVETLISWVDWSADGKLTYTAGRDGTVRAWDAATGSEKFVFKQNGDAAYNVVLVTPDSASLVIASESGRIYLANARTGKKIRDFYTEKMGGAVSGMVSKDGTLVVLSGINKTVRIWDVSTGTLYYTINNLNDVASGCAMTADCRRIVASLRDKTLLLWGVPPR